MGECIVGASVECVAGSVRCIDFVGRVHGPHTNQDEARIQERLIDWLLLFAPRPGSCAPKARSRCVLCGSVLEVSEVAICERHESTEGRPVCAALIAELEER